MTPQEQIAPEKSIQTNISRVLEWRNRNKYTFNLIALILFLILLPLFSENTASQYLVYILIILVLISAIFTISGNRSIPDYREFFCWTEHNSEYFVLSDRRTPFYESSIIIPLFFFGFVTIILFSAIIREQKTTFDIICGAISVYFLIGITWAYGIMVLELLAPGSFDIAGVVPTELRYLPDFISFSFSVLTTTGNFNVTALTPFSRMIMMFEMITGTLFIAILISWLVGKVLTRERAS